MESTLPFRLVDTGNEVREAVVEMELKETTCLPEGQLLGVLNQRFHDQLKILRDSFREQLKDATIPVVVRIDSRLILALGESVTVLHINESLYHQLKALSHIPLLLFLAFHNDSDRDTTTSDIKRALTDLGNDRRLPSSVLSIIEQAIPLLIDSTKGPSLGFSAVRQFNKALQPAFQKLTCFAAQDEANQTRYGLEQLKLVVANELTWGKTFYVVCAGHQPRYKQLAKLIFRRWVYEETASPTEVEHRVLYGESLETVNAARDLVVNRLTNSLIGDAFLDSPLSMNQDVLGEAGKLAVERAFGSAG